MEYYSAFWNSAICNSVDGPKEYCVQWNESDKERQILYAITYMWNLKNKMNDYNKTEIDLQI